MDKETYIKILEAIKEEQLSVLQLIDALINEGFTLEEIEECLYYGYCDEI